VLRKRIATLPPPRLARRVRRRQTVRVAQRYLRGLEGIEIGGSAQNDFGVNALNVDRYASMETVYKRHERDVWGRPKPVDLVAPGDRLPFADNAWDFVLASHVLEHIPDPIAALEEWMRVAREYVFLVVPHRDRTFDRDRPLTKLAELIERHATGFSSEEDRHWSVWTCETFLELCAHLGLEVVETRDPDCRRGNGFVVVISAARRRGVR
jgi:SAM-dependent methyltransferase